MRWMIILVLVGAVMVLGLGLSGFDFTGNVVLVGHHTVAICNESGFCQDYMVSCLDGEVVWMEEIEGAFVWNGEDWVDPRGNFSVCG